MANDQSFYVRSTSVLLGITMVDRKIVIKFLDLSSQYSTGPVVVYTMHNTTEAQITLSHVPGMGPF